MSDLRRNIELKARLRDPDAARGVAESLADRPCELQSQCDTYFHCRHGRLKLREIDGRAAQLVWYDRANEAVAKSSDYRLIEVVDAAGLKAALGAALGVRAIVRKKRQIYRYHNVRIHIDDVDQLGSFLEFEAVLENPGDEQEKSASSELVDRLANRFELGLSDLMPLSYGDMLAMQTGEKSA